MRAELVKKDGRICLTRLTADGAPSHVDVDGRWYRLQSVEHVAIYIEVDDDAQARTDSTGGEQQAG